MTTWQEVLQNSITSSEQLYDFFVKNETLINDKAKKFIPNFPMRINPYFLGLIEKEGDPIWRQCVPHQRESQDSVCINDPLGEEQNSPVPFLIHKYPDRAVLLAHHQCAMYCRFCTRNRMVGKKDIRITDSHLENCYEYLQKTPQVREVLLSGGDPLLLPDEKLESILKRLSEIESVDVIRIGSRVPSTLPMRITPELVQILKKYHPLYINIHFNHPLELTPEARKACTMLADGGIVLGGHTVLLKGINDSSEVLRELFLEMLKIRVKPYYLFQADLAKGTDHFRTHSSVGPRLIKSLYGHISGMAIPKLALDAPNGDGKILLSPDYIKERGENLIFENYLGKLCSYPEADI